MDNIHANLETPTTIMDNIPVEPSSNKEKESRKSIIDRFFRQHLSAIENARAEHDSAKALTSFLVMITHVRNHNLTYEEIGTDIKQLTKEQVLYHRECAKNPNGKSDASMEMERLKKCLDMSHLTEADLNNEN